MEPHEKEDCRMNGWYYAHGAEMCGDEACSICNEGIWESSMNIYPDIFIAPRVGT